MHILLAIAGIATGIAIWWYRLKYLGDAASEVADSVGRVRGKIRRRGIQKQTALSPITAIDDPVVAAATLITAIVAEDRLVDPDTETRIRTAIGEIAHGEKLDEAMVYAIWATNQVADVAVVIDRAGDFLAKRLDEREKQQLLAMIEAAVDPGQRPPLLAQRIERLQRRLGLPAN